MDSGGRSVRQGRRKDIRTATGGVAQGSPWVGQLLAAGERAAEESEGTPGTAGRAELGLPLGLLRLLRETTGIFPSDSALAAVWRLHQRLSRDRQTGRCQCRGDPGARRPMWPGTEELRWNPRESDVIQCSVDSGGETRSERAFARGQAGRRLAPAHGWRDLSPRRCTGLGWALVPCAGVYLCSLTVLRWIL